MRLWRPVDPFVFWTGFVIGLLLVALFWAGRYLLT